MFFPASLLVASALALPTPTGHVPFSTSFESLGYALVSDREDMRVYVQPRSPFPHIAAEGMINAGHAAIVRAILSYDEHAKYLNAVAESRVLERSDNHLLVYQRLDPPFLRDRDYILDVRWGNDTHGVSWVAWQSSPDASPLRDGVIRLELNEGSWQVSPSSPDGHTRVRYEIRLDFAGAMPDRLFRSQSARNIPELFAAICRMATGKTCPK